MEAGQQRAFCSPQGAKTVETFWTILKEYLKGKTFKKKILAQ